MKEQRFLPALRAHIEQLLDEGWVIAAREPLRCRVIDATRTQEAIAAEVLAIVEPLLPIVAQSHPERVS